MTSAFPICIPWDSPSASENPDPSVIARTQFVTIFGPAFDEEDPRRAADALVALDLGRPTELLVVNDGSSDSRTGEVRRRPGRGLLAGGR